MAFGSVNTPGILTATAQRPGLMTPADFVKLRDMEAGAQANVLEGVQLNGQALTPANKAVNIPLATTTAAGLMSPSHILELNGKARVSNGVTLWVAPDGDDTTGDGTENNPFATIQRAVDELGEMCINCTIQLKAGTYNYTISNRNLCVINKQGDLSITGGDPTNTIVNITSEVVASCIPFAIKTCTVSICNMTIRYYRSLNTESTTSEDIFFNSLNGGCINVVNVSLSMKCLNCLGYVFYAQRFSSINIFQANIDALTSTRITE